MELDSSSYSQIQSQPCSPPQYPDLACSIVWHLIEHRLSSAGPMQTVCLALSSSSMHSHSPVFTLQVPVCFPLKWQYVAQALRRSSASSECSSEQKYVETGSEEHWHLSSSQEPPECPATWQYRLQGSLTREERKGTLANLHTTVFRFNRPPKGLLLSRRIIDNCCWTCPTKQFRIIVDVKQHDFDNGDNNG